MYQGVLGACTTVTGATCVATLPHTGGYRPLFVVAVSVLAFGVITLAVSGISALKQARSKA